MNETLSIRREQRSGPKRHLPHISKKDSISISFTRAKNKMQLILEGNAEISDLFNHLHFIKDKRAFSDFCNTFFPYPFFYEKIMLDDDSSLPYFQIFTIFTATKHCPIEYKQELANDTAFTNFLFPTFLSKHQFQGAESCFQLFSHLIQFSIPLRDYLFTSGIIDYFNNVVAIIPQLAYLSKTSPYIERFYTRSLRFFCNCLNTEPVLNEQYIESIIQVFNTILDCQIGSVISYFVNRFKKSKQIKKNYPQIYEILASYISSNFSNVDNPQIISIIYKYLRNIDSDEYYNLTMQYLVNVDSIKVQRQCLKQIIRRHDDWMSSKGEEICSTILEIFSSLPYQLQTLCIQILLLYCPIDNLINEIILGYILQFAGDKSIGLPCLTCIFNILSNAALTKEQQTLIIDLVTNENEQLFTDLVSDGTAEQSELASSILSLIEDFGNE